MVQETAMAQDAHGTIFDDVFKTILEKMPGLAIPLINEAFGRNYPLDTEIEQVRSEYHTKYRKIISDSHLLIGNRRYHLECQSTSDGEMIVRMLEYDFAIGLEYIEKEDGKYKMKLPDSCVLFLRGTKTEKKNMEMEVEFADGGIITYSVPGLWLSDYTIQDMMEKKLLFLIPYYIIKYEKSKNRLDDDDGYLSDMLEEYREIVDFLEAELLDREQEKAYRDLIELITRIADYILRDTEKIRREMDGIVGGKVLELESDRLIGQGEKQGMEKRAKRMAWRMHEKSYSDADIADLLECSIDTIRGWLYEAEAAAK